MSFQEAWPTADPDAVGGGDDLTPPPDGAYCAVLMDGAAFTAKSGSDFVKMAWKVVGGPQDSFEWTVLLGFKSQAQANMTKKQVRELGIDVDTVDTLEGLGHAVFEKCGSYFDVTVKRDGKFENTYVDGPTNGTQTGFVARSDVPVDQTDFAPAPVPATVPDDDIPF